ncbi:hypothetical protein [Anaerosporobacter sp.]|uniref:hypothetical protein n=1 Tax=Anaerosporobacter sp. TaxID=1872529 RepID=UPI00286F4A17|nr:hypothetical protein [Anaerosporobacter sp.]
MGNINLELFESKGNVLTEYKDNLLYMTTTRKTMTTRFNSPELKRDSYIYIKKFFKLPLRVDLMVKIDTPGLYVFFGNGHLNFGTPWSDNRRMDDIVEPNSKPRSFDNYIPMNEFVNISIIYDLKEMQILINGEERYYSKKEKYMKSSLFKEMNEDGFELKIACDKRTEVYIKTVSVREFEDTANIVHSDDLLTVKEQTKEIDEKEVIKHTFESCTLNLPVDIKAEVVKMDGFLKSLKPMKFKRQIEKHGNKITYVASDYGFSYGILPSYDTMHHELQWYILTNCKPEFWHRKADMMEETLNELAKKDLLLAQRMFDNLNECVGCSPCVVKTSYNFNGRKKIVCHGQMELKMKVSDFEDVREFINTINELLASSS